MNLCKSLVAASLAVFAVQASAQSFSSVAASVGDYAAPVFITGTPSLAYEATGSIPAVRLSPLYDSGTYLVVQPGGTATIDLAGATSFSFLWGSPDATNMIEIDGVSFTGNGSLGALANSSNANTRWATFTSETGMHDFSITTGTVAFEIAVTNPVPEPETYALMLAGLGAIGFVARRRKNA